MTKFRPCIDLHEGKVKQIVGGSLRDSGPGPRENFVSDKAPAWYASKFRRDGLTGGHVIRLGPGNDAAAREALAAWPGGLQIGGGISLENAREWLAAGASHVIVTSWLFDAEGRFQAERLVKLSHEIGVERLVVDLSCRACEDGWVVAMNRWQTPTDMVLEDRVFRELAPYCAEFLIHAADVEGLCHGIDAGLVMLLGCCAFRPITYAGGASRMADLHLIDELSGGGVDVTVGSALELFGGSGLAYDDLVAWNSRV